MTKRHVVLRTLNQNWEDQNRSSFRKKKKNWVAGRAPQSTKQIRLDTQRLQQTVDFSFSRKHFTKEN